MPTNTGVFVLRDTDTLVAMQPASFVTEDDFQDLIARFPALLAGDQIDTRVPRRFLLVRREQGVADGEGAGARWSLDHLFLDQDGVPTLVEVKRASDTRLRREVVGQMLDYAANGVQYWPVEALRAQVEALQDGVHQAGAQSLGRLHDEVLRMTRLVDDLHELARADSHALGLRLEAVRPGEIMGEVVSRFAPRSQASGLRLDATALDPSGALTMADPDRLRQVFANLVENAIRYTDPGGTILVSETHTPAAIVLTVQDTAPGVPESKLPRLFERFFRVDGSRSRQTGGSGLGLAICRAIVEAHAGTISASPSALGGLAVTVSLPVAAGARA